MAMQMQVEKITPELAAKYLKHNTDNYRKISKSKVQSYAAEMKAGKWQLNGEGITFDETGKLKNGQHRLAAIILANVPIDMTVIRGVADNVTIYDTGMTRTTAQMAQASNCGDITKLECSVGNAIVGRFDNRGTSKGILLDWLQKHCEELKRAYRLTGATGRKSLSSRTSCVLASYMMLRSKEMKSYEIETFYKVFSSGNTVGTDGYEPSSALVARRMFEERYKGIATNGKTIREQTEILLYAMQDFSKSKKRQLNYQIKEPLKVLEMVDAIRKEDGIA